MSDTTSPTSNREALLAMVSKIESHSERTGDWLPWRTVEQLIAELSSAVRTGQSPERTHKNMAAIMQKYIAQRDARDAQQTKPATQVTHARKAGV